MELTVWNAESVRGTSSMNKLLKFITCGSVDDGKSTLIGNLIFSSKSLFTDQVKTLEMESKMLSEDGFLDYSLLLDGLSAEREQKITIDVAYRYFSTKKRSFIVADTPGHEQYTRNMAVGASFAELAIIIIDANHGVLDQTKRHARICSMMGIKHFAVAINKMDTVNYDANIFNKIKDDFSEAVKDYSFKSLDFFPVSAKMGDNITKPSGNMPWFSSKPLLSYLEDIEISGDNESSRFVMPVQRVSRPNMNFRGFQGQVSSGSVSVGDTIVALPNKQKAKVKSLIIAGEKSNTAYTGQPLTIELDREIDVSKGSVITSDESTNVGSGFIADLLWMDDHEMMPGRNYYFKVGTKTILGTITKVKYKIDVNTGQRIPSERIQKNDLAKCFVRLSEKIVFDSFAESKDIGSFIMINRITNSTSSCGVIKHIVNDSDNIFLSEMDINRQMKSDQKDQKPITVWLTGLPASGKTTMANALEKKLFSMGKHTTILDGDNLRHGINNDLGFTDSDRVENIRRTAEISKIMNDSGLISIVSLISPFDDDRQRAAEIIGKDNFILVYISTPRSVCEIRDPKGLYAKARRGEIKEFVGVSKTYEEPQTPDISIDTSNTSIEDAVDIIIKEIKKR
jgi:bifunctional enzyme CysN/CysC